MRIIIEGCDGTGKTTLAKALAEKYGLGIIHVTNRDSNTFDFYKQSFGKDDVVWDRNVIGEIIYPKIFWRKGNIDEIDLEYLIKRAKSMGIIFLVLTADYWVLRERIDDRGEEFKSVRSHLGEINDSFCEIARKYDLPLIDTSKMSIDEICETYIKKEKRHHGKKL